MRRYRKYNWSELIENFEASGLSQTEFCQRHDINPKYFSQKRAAFKAKVSVAPSFIAVDVAAVAPSSPEAQITLKVGRCTVQCPATLPLSSVADLVKQLA